jgi:hypothetical protein
MFSRRRGERHQGAGAVAGEISKICKGHIPGLLLPQNVWIALARENIRTIVQLDALAMRIEHLVPGIGLKSAKAIRAELARIAGPDRLRNEIS